MHLTRLLNFYKKFHKVPGLVYSGKNRVTPGLKPMQLRNAVKWMLLEEDNTRLLNNPYITQEEENNHMIEGGFREKKITQRMARLQAERKFKDHRPLSEHLEHLNVTKQWE